MDFGRSVDRPSLPRWRRCFLAKSQPRAFDGLCDDEGVPLICPTCQVFAQSASVPATACYLAWGRFRYFWLGATATWRRDILFEAARSSEACSWSSATSKVAATRSRRARGGLARPALCSRSGLIIEWQRRKRTLKRVLACRSVSGAPRPTKMGTTPSRFPYDAEARDTLQSASLRCSAI